MIRNRIRTKKLESPGENPALEWILDLALGMPFAPDHGIYVVLGEALDGGHDDGGRYVEIRVKPSHEPAPGVGETEADGVTLAAIVGVLVDAHARVEHTRGGVVRTVGAAVADDDDLERLAEGVELGQNLPDVAVDVRGRVVGREDQTQQGRRRHREPGNYLADRRTGGASSRRSARRIGWNKNSLATSTTATTAA